MSVHLHTAHSDVKPQPQINPGGDKPFMVIGLAGIGGTYLAFHTPDDLREWAKVLAVAAGDLEAAQREASEKPGEPS